MVYPSTPQPSMSREEREKTRRKEEMESIAALHTTDTLSTTSFFLKQKRVSHTFNSKKKKEERIGLYHESPQNGPPEEIVARAVGLGTAEVQGRLFRNDTTHGSKGGAITITALRLFCRTLTSGLRNQHEEGRRSAAVAVGGRENINCINGLGWQREGRQWRHHGRARPSPRHRCRFHQKEPPRHLSGKREAAPLRRKGLRGGEASRQIRVATTIGHRLEPGKRSLKQPC